MKKPLWTPSKERVEQSNMNQFMQYVQEHKGIQVEEYWALHNWSVEEPAAFWSSIWDYCGVIASEPYENALLHADDMLNAQWFTGARLNFAENLLRCQSDQIALLFRNENRTERQITYKELRHEVRRLAHTLREKGVQKGDRVAGYLPNLIETVIAMLATTSIGAIWSSTSPDFGHRGVLDRFGQIEPKVLFTADGYFYKSKPISSLERVAGIIEAIPSIEHVVVIPYTCEDSDLKDLPKAHHWNTFLADEPSELLFEQLPFDHPLYIMYSSGTTGVPKCIVHGAGGTLLQHLKEHRLHTNVSPGTRLFYFTTCGWMMWNWLVSGLASEATLLLFDGSPFFPNERVLWEMAEETQMEVFGTSAKYLAALEKTGLKPREEFDGSSIQTILSTGSPLSDASFEYVYRDIKEDVHLASISGGTDLISCFALGNPQLPVYSEELQCPGLGMNVQAFGDDGTPVADDKGELVCTTPFPCQPIQFWNDPDNKRYHGAYFDVYPNVWRHGDFVEVTANKGLIMYGRSDATLNPGGVRIGTSEIYRAIEPLPELLDSLVVGRNTPDSDVEVLLFAKLAEDVTLDEELIKKLRSTIRKQTTPRHVPAAIYAVQDIPYTISGKKVELAVRRVIHGLSVPNRDALANPEALEHFRDLDALPGGR